jgi:DnaK suppressor protein
MNIEYLQRKLVREEQQLISILDRLADEARPSSGADVLDFADRATVDQGIWGASEESTVVSRTLQQVHDALRRIALGTYGKCLVCRRQIERNRLEAVPWTPYCQHDQEKQEMQETAGARSA